VPMTRLLAVAAPLALWSLTALAGALPDHRLTPGTFNPSLSVAAICSTKWGKDARHVTAAMKRQVFTEYGLTGNTDPYCQPKGCEIDHLISRELGGSDAVKNLWPQSYAGPWNAHEKDRLENLLHRDVCSGAITLDKARTSIAGDWTAAYRQLFGSP
jgi:hypothetical protein